jgi:hypothetical protein
MRWELASWSAPWTLAPGNKSPSHFKADWPNTLRLLADETDRLDAGLVVIEISIEPGQLSRDRQTLRSSGPGHPGVRVVFESKHGQQRFETAQFTNWQANVRAVALGLGALRAMDRWGLNRPGAQYAGYLQLEAGPSKPVFDDPKKAIRWMIERAGASGIEQGAPDQVYRRLAGLWSQDRTGDEFDREQWDKLQAARVLLADAGVI